MLLSASILLGVPTMDLNQGEARIARERQLQKGMRHASAQHVRTLVALHCQAVQRNFRVLRSSPEYLVLTCSTLALQSHEKRRREPNRSRKRPPPTIEPGVAVAVSLSSTTAAASAVAAAAAAGAGPGAGSGAGSGAGMSEAAVAELESARAASRAVGAAAAAAASSLVTARHHMQHAHPHRACEFRVSVRKKPATSPDGDPLPPWRIAKAHLTHTCSLEEARNSKRSQSALTAASLVTLAQEVVRSGGTRRAKRLRMLAESRGLGALSDGVVYPALRQALAAVRGAEGSDAAAVAGPSVVNGHTQSALPAAPTVARPPPRFSVDRPTFVLFGDSITQASFSAQAGWGAMLADTWTRCADVINRGYSGYNTRWAREVASRVFARGGSTSRPALAVVWFGANDAAKPEHNLRQHVPVAEFKVRLCVCVCVCVCVCFNRRQ